MSTAPSELPYPLTNVPIFLLHAVLAVLAWGLLSPLGHILSRLTKPGSPTRAFALHRLLMLSTIFLTILLSLLAFLFASPRTPLAHRLLGVSLLLATLVQGAMGALRPERKETWERRAWKRVHRAWGAGTMALGAFLVHHSLLVFRAQRWVVIAVNSLLGVMAIGVVAVHIFVEKPQPVLDETQLVRNSDERELEAALREGLLVEEGAVRESGAR